MEKIIEIVILACFVDFSPKIWVEYYPSSIRRPYLEPPHQGDPFRPPNMRVGSEILFSCFPSIFKNLSVVREPKKEVLWEKKRYFVIHTPRHGISPKNLKRLSLVQNETPL